MQWAHYNASSVWTHESVDSCVPESNECRLGEYNSIALDPTNNRPVIAFSFHDIEFTDSLLYTAYNGTNWVADWSAPGFVPSYISLAIDSTGKAHVSWSEGGFKYARRDSQDTWTQQPAWMPARHPGYGLRWRWWVRLAKVVHYNTASGVFAYIGHERSGWLAPVTVATQGHDVGSCTSLAVDGIGRSHISYFDSTSNSLQYARYNDDGSWFKNTIDSAGTANCFSVMAVNPATNEPSVGFIRGGSLWYSLGNSSWLNPMQVDTGVNEHARLPGIWHGAGFEWRAALCLPQGQRPVVCHLERQLVENQARDRLGECVYCPGAGT